MTAKTEKTGLTLDDLRKRKKPNRTEVWIAGDSEAAGRLAEAQEQMDRTERVVRLKATPTKEELRDAQKARAEAEALKEEIKDTLIKFVFEAISIPAYDKLVEEHTWTEPEKKAWRKKNPGVTDDQMDNLPGWNPDTFYKSIIIESFIEPAITKDEMAEWLDGPEWNQTEVLALFQAAMEVNNSRRVVDLGKG